MDNPSTARDEQQQQQGERSACVRGETRQAAMARRGSDRLDRFGADRGKNGEGETKLIKGGDVTMLNPQWSRSRLDTEMANTDQTQWLRLADELQRCGKAEVKVNPPGFGVSDEFHHHHQNHHVMRLCNDGLGRHVRRHAPFDFLAAQRLAGMWTKRRAGGRAKVTSRDSVAQPVACEPESEDGAVPPSPR
ncbi:unnamed protein product [Lampetra fluviatilis]